MNDPEAFEPETTENGARATDPDRLATESGESAQSPEYHEPRAFDEPTDPGAAPEDEGIPDLQDGTPEAQRAEDPQRMPVPGERPVAAESFGTTPAEQVEGESLDDRLAEEEPDVGAGGADRAAAPVATAAPEAGQLSDDPLPGSRPANQDSFATESDAEGLSGEEAAVHVSDDDEAGLGLRFDEDEPGGGPPLRG